MFTKTILAAGLVFASASVALASEADPNLLNRYPAYNMTTRIAAPTTSRGAALTMGHAAAIRHEWTQFDRASWSTGGGA